MNKVALKTIGFKEQKRVDDAWQQSQVEQQQQTRSIPDVYIDGIERFRSIDQDQASITEELVNDENGMHYHQQVVFTVRTKYDRDLAKRFERRPVVLHVWSVDGDHYVIGTKTYPAYLNPVKTKSRDTVESAFTVEYDSTTPVM